MFPQEVQANSPADLAGLKSDTDFVIGADSVLHEVNTTVSDDWMHRCELTPRRLYHIQYCT